ncbi:MAG TPA: AI-2E family transporter [Candidatus Altiarchaeales archaeon]|nr:AI-2E family transporter [Candidatus Altiarchaeales archaeon]
MKLKNNIYWIILGIVSSLLFIYMTLPFLDGIVYGIFLYHATRPIYRRIEGRIGYENISAFVSLSVIIVLVIVPIIFIGINILNTAMNMIDIAWLSNSLSVSIWEIHTLLPDDVKDILNERVYEIIKSPESLLNTVTSVMSQLASIGGTIAWSLLTIFIMFVVAFFLLRDGTKLRRWLVNEIIVSDKKLAIRFLNDIDADMHRIFFGSVLVVFITAILAALTFTILNIIAPPEMTIPFLLGIAILCGIATLVPVVGIKIVWIPLFLYLAWSAYYTGHLIDYMWYLILFLIAINLIVDLAPDMIIRPLVSGREIHTGLIMLAFIFGPIVFGIKGVFLGPIIVIVTKEFFKTLFPRIMINR